ARVGHCGPCSAAGASQGRTRRAGFRDGRDSVRTQMTQKTQRTLIVERAEELKDCVSSPVRLLRYLRPLRLCCVLLAVAACKRKHEQVEHQAGPVPRRDINGSAIASGPLQPDTTVEVKSKASGEILKLSAQTGQLVKRGAQLVLVDPRNARNALAQAQANL